MDRRRVIIFAVIALALVITLPLLMFEFYFPFARYQARSYAAEFSNYTGLHPRLTDALMILLMFPLLAGMYFMFSFSRRRRWIGAIILMMFSGLYSASLWLASRDALFARDGTPLKCYVITESGVKFGSSAGVDPETGRECRWLTTDIIPKLLAMERKMQEGTPFRPLDPPPGPGEFFSGYTGEPLVWYARLPDGGYEFFDTPGFHGTNRDELLPVTPAVVADWQRQLANERAAAEAQARTEALRREEEARRQAEEEQRRREKEARDKAEAARLKAEEERRLQAEREAAEQGRLEREEQARLARLRGYLNAPAGTGEPLSIAFSFAPADPASRLDEIAASRVASLITERGGLPGYAASLFKRGYREAGLFEAAFAGDPVSLRESGAFEAAEHVGLAETAASCRASDVAAGLVSCRVVVTFVIFDPQGATVDRGQVEEVAPGFGEQQGVGRAAELLAERDFERLFALTSKGGD